MNNTVTTPYTVTTTIGIFSAYLITRELDNEYISYRLLIDGDCVTSGTVKSSKVSIQVNAYISTRKDIVFMTQSQV